MANIRIIDLPTQTEVDESVYIPVESQTKGTKKYPIGEVLEDVNDAVDRVEAAIDAVDYISSQAIPLMSNDIRGGAKLEPNGGLRLVNDSLGLVESTQESNGEVSGSLVAVTANGHAEQVTTTGKNLFPRIASQTVQGVTFEVANDGTITFTGTATGTIIQVNAGVVTLEAGTYTLSDSQFGTGYRLQINNTQTNAAIAWTANASTVTFTLSEATQVTFLVVVIGGNTPTGTAHPQLELGSTATEYEPYTGGAPSPSPDYPQEIQVVRGRNLLGGRVSNTNVNPSGVVASDMTRDLLIAHVESGKTYTISGAIENGSVVYAFYVSEPALGSTAYNGRLLSYTNNVTFVAPIDGYVAVRSLKTFTSVQLELGSTPQPYVPYGHVGMEAQGRNLIDLGSGPSDYHKPEIINGISGSTILLKVVGSGSTFAYRAQRQTAVGKVTISATASYIDSRFFVRMRNASDTAWLTSNEATIGGMVYNQYYGGWYVTNNATLKPRVTLDIPDCLYWELGIGWSSDQLIVGTVQTLENLQLELGSTATEYQPYFHTTTPIPLPPRGWVAGLSYGTSDILLLDGAGEVEWELETSMETFDGSESWVKANDSYSRYRIEGWGNANNVKNASSIRLTALYASRLIAKWHGEAIELWDNAIYIATGSIWIHNLSTESAEDFSTFLQSHPVTILYPLATPVIENMGYVNMPSIPADAIVTIPELDALNVKYIVRNTAAKDYAEAWEKKIIRTNPTGGLKHTNDGFAIDTLVHDSMDDIISGGIAELTAKGHAEQFSTSGKNLLNFTTDVRKTGAGSNTTVRSNIDGNGVWAGITASNYYSSIHISEFSIVGNSVSFKSANSGYGIGVETSVSPSTAYVLSAEMTNGEFTVGSYDASGNFLGRLFIVDGVITTQETCAYIIVVMRATSVDTTATFTNPQLELGSTATEYEPYTGGAPSPSPDYPQEIQVVRGRNLLDESSIINGYYIADSGVVTQNSNTKYYDQYIKVSGTLTCQYHKPPTTFNAGTAITYYDDSKSFVSREILTTGTTSESNFSKSFNVPGNATYLRIHTSIASENVQLTLGSTPKPYVPYGHVGMEARDPDTDELISCTALPLPERGWVAGLSDGTADSLRLDGAGKVEWTLDTWIGIVNLLPTVYTINGMKGAVSGLPTSFARTPMLCDRARYAASTNATKDTFYNNPANIMMIGDSDDTIDDLKTKYNGATVLYPLATPVIEDCGYVNMPAIPSDCTISIPELDALGIRYFVDDTVTQYGREIIARVRSEYEDRLTALEQAVAELATS